MYSSAHTRIYIYVCVCVCVYVLCEKCSPVTDDGYFLVSASKDGKPMLRNGETGDWIGTFEGHKGAVWAAKLNKPALLALTASADFTARVWDALTGDELHLFQHKHIVRTCHFSENLTKVMTGGMEKIVRIFDLNKPEEDAFCLNGSPSGIRCGLFAMDDTVLFTACASDSGIRCVISLSIYTHTYTHVDTRGHMRLFSSPLRAVHCMHTKHQSCSPTPPHTHTCVSCDLSKGRSLFALTTIHTGAQTHTHMCVCVCVCT